MHPAPPNTTVCYKPASVIEQSFLVGNGVITAVLAAPAILLNSIVLRKYWKFPTRTKHKNIIFIIFMQAVVNLVHILLTCPGVTIGHLVYFSDMFSYISVEKKENSCVYWYIIFTWLMVTSVLGRLLTFVYSSVDKLLAIWKPVFWYNHLKDRQEKCKLIYSLVWISAGMFAMGDVYAHIREFFSGEEQSAKRYHLVRGVACLILILVLVSTWGFTLIQGFVALHKSTRRIRAISDNITPANSHVMINYVNRKFTVTNRGPGVSRVNEWRFVRTFSMMVMVFLLGYSPYVIYFLSYLIDPDCNFFESSLAVRIIWSMGGSIGIAFVSCWSPLVVLIGIKPYKSKNILGTIRKMLTWNTCMNKIFS